MLHGLDHLNQEDYEFLVEHGMRDVCPCPTCERGHLVTIMRSKRPDGLWDYTLLNGSVVHEMFLEEKGFYLER